MNKNHFKQQKYEYFYTYDLNNNFQNGFVLTQRFSKKIRMDYKQHLTTDVWT